MERFKKHHLYSLIAIILVLGATSAYFYRQSSHKVPDQVEAQQLSEAVGKLMILPTDETPTIATVSDLSALKNQAFFVDAENGDKVLIYANAKKAILYRPSGNRIVNVAPLNLGTGTAGTQ